jgi:hypothetical protein
MRIVISSLQVRCAAPRMPDLLFLKIESPLEVLIEETVNLEHNFWENTVDLLHEGGLVRLGVCADSIPFYHSAKQSFLDFLFNSRLVLLENLAAAYQTVHPDCNSVSKSHANASSTSRFGSFNESDAEFEENSVLDAIIRSAATGFVTFVGGRIELQVFHFFKCLFS